MKKWKKFYGTLTELAYETTHSAKTAKGVKFNPGTLIRRLKDGSVVLVGDININTGACDCCPYFDHYPLSYDLEDDNQQQEDWEYKILDIDELNE